MSASTIYNAVSKHSSEDARNVGWAILIPSLIMAGAFIAPLIIKSSSIEQQVYDEMGAGITSRFNDTDKCMVSRYAEYKAKRDVYYSRPFYDQAAYQHALDEDMLNLASCSGRKNAAAVDPSVLTYSLNASHNEDQTSWKRYLKINLAINRAPS